MAASAAICEGQALQVFFRSQSSAMDRNERRVPAYGHEVGLLTIVTVILD